LLLGNAEHGDGGQHCYRYFYSKKTAKDIPKGALVK
jgi:hypothetical protein